MTQRGEMMDSSQHSSTGADSIESPVSRSVKEHQWLSINQNNCQVRYRDDPRLETLRRFRSLRPTDIILMLTPLVPPRHNSSDEEAQYDPYEYLGRALLARHQNAQYRRQPTTNEDLSDDGENHGKDLQNDIRERQRNGKGAVAHVPYTNKNLITSTHRGFMRLAQLIIFVAHNDSELDHPHVHAAIQAFRTRLEQRDDERDITVVLTSNTPGAFDLFDIWPTVIQTQDYSKESLDAIASILFGEIESPSADSTEE